MKKFLLALALLAAPLACRADNDGIINGTGVHGSAFIKKPAPPTPTPAPTPISFAATEDTTRYLRNPRTGLQAGDNCQIETGATNPNSWPLQVSIYRFKTIKDVEPTEGVRDFTPIRDCLYKARAAGNTVNIRLYEEDMADDIGVPAWMRTTYGGYVVHNPETSTPNGVNLNVPDWDNASLRTAFKNTLVAANTALSWHPAFGTIDTGWGEYNEVNFSSHTVQSWNNISSWSPSVGAHIPNPLNASLDSYYDNWYSAFTSLGAKLVNASDSLYSFNTSTGRLGFGARGDCWGWQNTAATCPSGGQWMCDLYPRAFATDITRTGDTPSYPNAWQTAPIILETCGFIDTGWTNYAKTASFQWALDQHAAELNLKGKFSTSSVYSAVDLWLKGSGYRYVPTTISNPPTVTAGSNLSIDSTWVNHGTIPDYGTHYLSYKFTKQGGGDIYKVSTNQLARWLPGQSYSYTHVISIPTWIDAGTYDVAVGITDADFSPTVELAISNANTNLWYNVTTVAVTNASPTANPTDLACNFATDGIYYSAADIDPLSFNGTDFSWCLEMKPPAGVGTADVHTLLAKGNVGVTGQEFSVFNTLSATSLSFRVSAGGANTTATYAAGLVAGTKYHACGTFDNTSKVVSIQVDNNTAATATASGSVSNTSNPITIGDDSAHDGKGWNAQERRIRVWKRKLTGTELTNQMNGVAFSDMTLAEKKGLYIATECDGSASGDLTDTFQGTTWTDTGGVTHTTW